MPATTRQLWQNTVETQKISHAAVLSTSCTPGVHNNHGIGDNLLGLENIIYFSVSTKKEWFSAHWPNGLGSAQKRDDGLLFTNQCLIIAPVRLRQTQLDLLVVKFWGKVCVQNLERNIGHWPCFPIPYFTCVRVFTHAGLRLIWIWLENVLNPKRGQSLPK